MNCCSGHTLYIQRTPDNAEMGDLRYLLDGVQINKTPLKLWLCKSIREFCRCRTSYPYLLKNFRTTYSVSNPIERPPRIEFDIKHDNCVEFLSSALRGFSGADSVRMGTLVHTYLIKLNVIGYIFLWNKLLNLYCKAELFYRAHRLFETMPQRDIVSYNTMVSSYVQTDHAREALHLYSKMKEEKTMPNHITLAGLIGAGNNLKALHLREAFHAQAIQYGLNSNAFVGSSLVEGYTKHRSLEEAVRAFGEIARPDLVSCNIMIDGCARNNSKRHALIIFYQMLKGKMEFDGFTLTSIAKTCSEAKDLSCGLQLHGCAIKSGFAHETPVCNSLITMYSKCEKGMSSAIKIFGGISDPNIISWTAMIAGFMQNRCNREAIEIYQEMLRLGVTENEFSFASILPVYSNLANLEQGRPIHARILKSWFGLDLSVNNALIDMYSKCGSLEDAHMVFLTMGNHDVVSFTTMITCFGQHGKGRESLNALQQLTSEGLKPDDVTFLGCLCACSHAGLIDEGIHVFRMMIDVHYLKPRMEHFACVVDLLGRAGRLSEAEEFIEELGIESNVLVWEALLSACRLHGEMAVGERSGKKILELQPQGHLSYVSLASIYADRGLWEDKGVVREKLDIFGLKKDTGCSWVA